MRNKDRRFSEIILQISYLNDLKLKSGLRAVPTIFVRVQTFENVATRSPQTSNDSSHDFSVSPQTSKELESTLRNSKPNSSPQNDLNLNLSK